MGFRKIVVETKFRRASLLSTAMISRKARRRGLKRLQDVWRGWSEGDILNLKERLAHSGPHSGGIVQLTVREYRALADSIAGTRPRTRRGRFHRCCSGWQESAW